jgi:hypothetical protein
MSSFLLGRFLPGLFASLIAGSLAQAQQLPIFGNQNKTTAPIAKADPQFLENKGQWDDRASFLTRTGNLNVWITREGLVLDFFRRDVEGGQSGSAGHVVGMSFVGANKATGLKPLKKTRLHTDFVNPSGEQSFRGVPSFREVLQTGVYPGIDVRNYIDTGKARYDILVAPNADPSLVKIRFTGADKVSVDGGQVVLGTSVGDLKQGGLYAYQVINGQEQKVEAEFRLESANVVSFKLGHYDKSRPLVIDPLIYGSYYGGDDGFDEVRSVVADPDGGVYMTGMTQAARFPAIYGPYGFQLRRQMAYVSKLMGDAYIHEYAAYLGGTLNDIGQHIALDPFGHVWIAGRTQSSDFPGNTRTNVQFLQWQNPGPANMPNTNATFVITFMGNETAPIPWNASAAQLQAALEALPGVAGNVSVSGGPLPDEMRVEFANHLPDLMTINNAGMNALYIIEERPRWEAQQLNVFVATPSGGTFTLSFGGQTTADIPWDASAAVVQAQLNSLGTVQAVGGVTVFARPGGGANIPQTSYLILFGNPTDTDPIPLITVDNDLLTGGTYGITGQSSQRFAWPQSVPTSGTFTLSFGGAATPALPYNATPAQIQTALEALASIGAGNVLVTGSNLPNQPAATITFRGTLMGPQPLVTVNSGALLPRPVYGVYKPHEIFITRFAKGDDGILNPLPTRTVIVGGERDEALSGLAIVPKDNPAANDPVQLVIAGTTSINIPGISGVRQGQDGFIARFNFQNGAFTQNTAASIYVGGSFPDSITGLAVDAEGSAYVTGTVSAQGQIDTSLNPGVFATTPGVFFGGRLLRGADAFVRKYNQAGGLVYSALLGGNGDDSGHGIAVDAAGNAYLTGVARSFNFHRTRGTYGEVFTAAPTVYVTKLNQNASQILYSTNLGTTGLVIPSGIAVDTRGNAYVAGVVDFSLTFPQPPGDPNLPSGVTHGTIPTSPDALKAALTSPTPPNLPTADGFLLVLNPTATSLVYGSYIGGFLDENVFAPYTDRFGDVWIMGSTDSFRQYQRVSSTGAAQVFTDSGSLPDNHLSPFAFKRSPDAFGQTGVNGVAYGIRESPFTAPAFINGVTYQRDGFVLRLRLGLPAVQNLTINPSSIAGGLGAFADATLTLSEPAPPGGIDITLTINNTAASFDEVGEVHTRTLFIPAGQAVGTFRVWSRPVNDLVPVQVRATLEGNFQIAVLNVVPWLNQLTISPTSVVGGNEVTGRIRLFQPAPEGGVDVQLSTTSGNLITFPAGTTVNVPEGQDTATFIFETEGVDVSTPAPITASLLGVGRTQFVTILPASLVSLTFSPASITGGSSSVGTVALNGKAGPAFNVNLTMSPAASGYTFPSQITFNPGDRTKSFTVQTPYVATNVQRVFTATRPAQGNYVAQSVQGTLFIQASDLISFTVQDNVLDVGQSTTGRVTINSPAGTGGAVVNISANHPVLIVPSTVTIPAGDTSVEFEIEAAGTALAQDTNVIVTATRGPVSINRTILVRKSTFSLSLQPQSVLGGNNSIGTITLNAPAPAGGLTFTVSSNNGAATVPAQVIVPANQSFATFTINTSSVQTTQNATISATLAGTSATAVLQIRAVGLIGISFNPDSVLGGSQTECTITLDAPAPAGGAVVALNSLFPSIAQIPSSVTIPQGQTSITFTVQTNRVSRTLATTVTATYDGQSVSTLLTVRNR